MSGDQVPGLDCHFCDCGCDRIVCNGCGMELGRMSEMEIPGWRHGAPEEYEEGPTWTYGGRRITVVYENGKWRLVITRAGRVEFIGDGGEVPGAPLQESPK